MRQYAEDRNLEFLLHFTKLSNLDTILEYGLVTRDLIERQGANDLLNDSRRIDGTSAVCVSINFPNYRLFTRYRLRNRRERWMVVVIEPSALWELPCAFCWDNAASKDITRFSIEDRMSIGAFKAMYESDSDALREQRKLDRADPTNPQAEVLMLEGVPPEYLQGIIVESSRMSWRLKQCYPNLPVAAHPDFFGERVDCRYW